MPILDNFDSNFIDDATQTSNGLMSKDDKFKLNNINLNDIDYISNTLNEINEYKIPQYIYGIKINTSIKDSQTCVSYTDDAAGFIPLSVNQSTGVCNYGSWKNIIDNVLGIKPCLVRKDGKILSYLNPDDYSKTIDGNTVDIESGTLGQVMINFNHVYYRFSVIDNEIWFQISNKQNDYTWIDTAFSSEDGIGSVRNNMLIGAYECSRVNAILQSISNKSPRFNLTFDEVEAFTSFGSLHMMNIAKKQFITFLGYLVTKSISLETTIGNGNIESDTILNTGTMNSKGLFYGKSTKNDGVKIFGIENFWGNQLEYMNGLVQKLSYDLDIESGTGIAHQHVYCKEFFPYDNIKDYNDIYIIEPNISGFISSIQYLNKYLYFPKDLNGSSNDYFKSYFQNGESSNSKELLHAIYSGNNKYDVKAGSEFLLLSIPDESVEVTTHLIY